MKHGSGTDHIGTRQHLVLKRAEQKKPTQLSYALYTAENFSLPLLKGSPNAESLGALPKGTELEHPLTCCLVSSLVYETENRGCYMIKLNYPLVLGADILPDTKFL